MSSILLGLAAIDPTLATQCRLLSLRQYELDVRIGTHDFERKQAQRMWFDVDLCVDLNDAPAASDSIAQTVDYDFVRTGIAQLVGKKHYEIQETLCDAIVRHLLEKPQIRAVRVCICKPDVYPDCRSVGVERVALQGQGELA